MRLARIVLPIPCKITFWVEMPPSWSRRKRSAMDGQPHKLRPDRDNYDKALMDALFENDSHVWSAWTVKRWSTVPAIEIEPLAEEG